jgi:sugar lactone lactonase YvrE
MKSAVHNVTTYPAPDVIVASDDLHAGDRLVLDPRTGKLVRANAHGGQIVETDPRTGEQTVTDVGTAIAAIAPRRKHPGFAAVFPEGFGFIVDGELEIADLLFPEPYLRLNDGKVDSRGRFWAGSSDTRFAPERGRLYRWDGASPSVVAASEFMRPAGLGWSADDSVMYLADSSASRLYSMPFNADEGRIGRVGILAEIDGPGVPAGLCVDMEQCVWIAMNGGGEVRRYDSRGTLIGAIAVPVSQPSGCVFGDDGTLFITSDRFVFAVRTGTEGVPVASFS